MAKIVHVELFDLRLFDCVVKPLAEVMSWTGPTGLFQISNNRFQHSFVK